MPGILTRWSRLWSGAGAAIAVRQRVVLPVDRPKPWHVPVSADPWSRYACLILLLKRGLMRPLKPWSLAISAKLSAISLLKTLTV